MLLLNQNIKRIFPAVALVFISFFASAQSYYLNGTAQSLGDECYQLTSMTAAQNGTVWYGDLLDLNEPFDLQFTMNFGTLDATGADGMVFVLQTFGTNALGISGGGIGFGGFNPSFGVEFDTWANGKYGDLGVDHIGMISNGSVSHTENTAIAGPIQMDPDDWNVEDGEDHIVRVKWNPTTMEVEVYFDCTFRLAGTIDLIDAIFAGQSHVWWGFTGSTGGAWNNQTVCLADNIITSAAEVSVCTGASVTLNAAGAEESDYLWSPDTYLDNASLASPACTPEEDIVYTVSYSDLCGTPIIDTVSVHVQDLEVSILTDPIAPITCDNTTTYVAGTSNFSDGMEYTWTAEDGANISQTTGPEALFNQGGTGVLVATFGDGECVASVTVEIPENVESYDFEIVPEFPLITCDQPEVELNVVIDETDAVFYWMGGNVDDASVIANTQGTWEVNVLNPNSGCYAEGYVLVAADFVQPEITMGFAIDISCTDPAVFVEGTSVSPEGYTPEVMWSWNSGALTQTDSLTPLAHEPGWYILEVEFSENGCSAIDSVEVGMAEDAMVDASELVMPNVFTPDMNGQNDFLEPFLANAPTIDVLGLMESYDLSVYNRWGSVIYENPGLATRWDGRSNGELVPAGTYYVVLDWRILCGGEQKGTLNGPVSIFYR